MKVTFPHMGNTYISVKVLLDTIGIDYVMPPICNKKTLENGLVHSPEFICLPFKTMLGDFIFGLENGANVILNGGSCGQCRQGYYGELQHEILECIGLKNEYININLSNMSFKDIYSKVRPYVKDVGKVKITQGIINALRTVFAVDKLFKLANYTRCREMGKGSVDKILKHFISTVHKTKGYHEIANLINRTYKDIRSIKIDKSLKPLKIAIIGEIFITCEPFTNLEIERKLGNLGVEVDNRMSIGMWIREHFIQNLLPTKSKQKPHLLAQDFMHTDDIGGHGIDTIGNAVLCSKGGYDGIIHLYPFTCMPEIIAQGTFSAIYEEYNVPIMTLILDELTGEAGYMTRLEAFVDMLQMRKSK